MTFDGTAKKYLVVLLLIVLGVVLLAMWLRSSNPTVPEESDLGAVLQQPAAAYTDLHGNPVSLSTYTGTPLVVNAWATWSPFSKAELAHLITLAEEFKDAVTIVAINRKESTNVARTYMQQYADTGALVVLLDMHDTFYTSIDGFAMPETVFYNSAGEKVTHTRGHMNLKEMRAHVITLLDAEQAE
ncbi:MAG: TlpA family protein disulfide reductase [Candidatus Pacebacteria bacterium]|nr:TlpA family protein disulfide reductase [Candidatus Paceibacterota bacterium]